MAYSDDCSLRIVVTNIRKGPVRRHERGIVEEDDLGRLFCHAGCKVAGVRLVIDTKRRDVSRGFGFVDFEDRESLDIALKLHNTEAKGLAGNDGKLRIERARATTDEGRKIQQELLDARNQTEEMEQELAFHEDGLNKLFRKVKSKRERQNQARAHDLQLQEEKRRQAMIRQALETIKDAEQRIHIAIEVVEEHATATGAIMISVDGEPTQRHQEEGSVCADCCATSACFPEDGPGPAAVTSGPWQHNGGATQHGAIAVLAPTAFESPAHGESAHKANRNSHPHAVESTTDSQGGDAIGDDLLSRAEQAEIRIRNTFIEFWVPPLVRTKSAPPMTLPGFPTSGTATVLAEALPLNSNKQSVPSVAKLLAADVSRALLEEKMDGPSSMDGSTVATAELRWGPHTDTSSKVSSRST